MDKSCKKEVLGQALKTSKRRAAARSRGARVFNPQLETAPDTKNRDGFPAYSDSSLEYSVARAALCNIVKDQFYTSAEESAKEALDLFQKCARTNPEYLLKAIKLARQNNLKLIVKVGIVALSANDQFCARYESEIIDLLRTFHPKQLLEYVEMQKSGISGKGLGYRQQRWVGEVIKGWDERKREYYTIKYRSDLSYLLRLTHPKFRHELHNFVLKGGEAAGERQQAFQSIVGSKDVRKIANTMVDYDIPWDVCKAFAPKTPEMYLAFMLQAGTNALLLNLASYQRAGVFETVEGIDTLKELLSTERLQRSRLLPIDFIKPYNMVNDRRIRNILIDALTRTFDNEIPGLRDKRISVSVDVSGSMNRDRFMEAGVLAYSIVRSCNNVWLTAFDDNLYEAGQVHYSGYGEILPRALTGTDASAAMEAMFKMKSCGATRASASITEATRRGEVYDGLVLITDGQENRQPATYPTFKEYQKKVNPRAELIVVNVANYAWNVAYQKDPHVIVYPALTPNVFRSLEYAGQSITKVVEKVNLQAGD